MTVATTTALLFIPAAVFVAIVEADSTPWIAGFAVLIMTVLIVPVVRGMITRNDTLLAAQQTAAATAAKEASEAAARREKREDDRHEAFQKLVGTLATISNTLSAVSAEMRLLNDHHKAMDSNRVAAVREILDRIDEIPDKVRQRPR